jgi:lipopolysaccharide transport system ATP-binding protein
MAGASPSPIVVDGVWKRFRRGRRADTLRELAPALLKSLSRRARPTDNEFWALRDLSFTVEPGEVLGIIGPNGAGKSTILSVLSRILWPDRGSVSVNGRIGALIELAASFHPDLTGRENVFLQGALLGMRRAEIVRRFDEIVEFAGFAEFIDTPVKHYSSGMNARLGFSVAAHLDPDVLLIDEVLAVGDRAFQQKAFGRLSAIVQRGIPVIVVSHQLDRVAALCHRAILLVQGQALFDGPAPECVARYISGAHLSDASSPDGCPITIDQLELHGGTERDAGGRMSLCLRGRVTGPVPERLALGVRVWALPDEEIIAAARTQAATLALPPSGAFSVPVALSLNLARGTYRLQAVAWEVGARGEWTRGPSAIISVNGPEGSLGQVWLDPQFERASS